MKAIWTRTPNAQIIREPTDCESGRKLFSCMYVKEPVPEGKFVYEGDAIAVRRDYFLQYQIFAETLERLNELVAQTMHDVPV